MGTAVPHAPCIGWRMANQQRTANNDGVQLGHSEIVLPTPAWYILDGF